MAPHCWGGLSKKGSFGECMDVLSPISGPRFPADQLLFDIQKIAIYNAMWGDVARTPRPQSGSGDLRRSASGRLG
jgi:hypothetical protein